MITKNKLGKFLNKNIWIFLIGIIFMLALIFFVLAEGGSAGVWMDLSANDTGNWAGSQHIQAVAVNPNDNLIYTGHGSDNAKAKFGVYNHSNGIWMNLSGNFTGRWDENSDIRAIVVDLNDSLIYVAGIGGGGFFGVYNHLNGIFLNLSGNDTNNWAGTDVYSLAFSPINGMVFTGMNSGLFGMYNHSTGIWMNLSGNDTNDFIGSSPINAMDINYNNNETLVYTGSDGGKLGVYNHSNGVLMNLSGNDTNNWAGESSGLTAIAVSRNDNLVYTGNANGGFGVYNHSNGVWMDLSANDTGNWVVSRRIFDISINPNDNLVYTAIDDGGFGVYNHSNGVWMDLSANDTGAWANAESDRLWGVTVNPNDNLIYTVQESGKFGVYNNTGTSNPFIAPPNITSLNQYPNNASTYSSTQFYNFNATIVNNLDDIDDVRFEFNNINYTPVNDTLNPTIFNITLPIQLGTGVYSYKWIANDSSNNQNVTSNATTVLNATGIGNLTLNDFQGNITTYVGRQFTINASLLTGVINGANINLTMNGTQLNFSSTGNISHTLTLSKKESGVNFTMFYSGNQNFSSFSETWFVEVSSTTPNITSLNEFPAEPQNYSSTQFYNFNATVVNTDGDVDDVTFEWNGLTNYTSVNTTANPSVFNVTLPTQLSAGNYTYRWITNNSANERNVTLGYYNLSRSLVTPTLFINATEHNRLNLTYPNQVNASYNTSNSEQSLFLYRNLTEITGFNGIFQDLPVAFYNFTINASQTENYTATTLSRFVDLIKGTPNVTTIINGTYANMTIEIGERITVNGTLNTGFRTMDGGTMNLSLETIHINSSSTFNVTDLIRFNTNKSNFNITIKYSGNQNWTEAYDTRYVNVEARDVILGAETLLNSTSRNGTMTFDSATVYSPEVIMGGDFIEIRNASWTNGELIFNVTGQRTDLNYTNINFTFDTSALPYLVNSSNSHKTIANNFTHNINGTLDVTIQTNACSLNSISEIVVNTTSDGYSRIYKINNATETTCFATGRVRLLNISIVNNSFTDIQINYVGGGGGDPQGSPGGGPQPEPEPEIEPEIEITFPTEEEDIPIIITPEDPRWRMQTDEGGGFYEFNMPRKTTRTKNLIFINLRPESVILNISCEKEFCQYVELAEEHFTLPLNTEIESKVSFTVTLPKEIQNGTYYADLVATDQYGNRGIIPLKVNMDENLSFIPFMVNKLGLKKILIKGVPGIPIWLLFILVGILAYALGKFVIFIKSEEAREGLAVLFALVISLVFLRII